MASTYPGAVDSLTNPTASDTLDSATVPHADQHSNANDAIEAIESTLGVNPQGGSASVVARLNTIDSTVAGKVASVTAGDSTVTVAGTATAPTVAVNSSALTIAPSQVTGTALTSTSTGTVSVMDFGAVGDGSTDDTTAIQAALDACPAGGIVLVPAKTFMVTAPIVVPPSVTLQGTHGNRINYNISGQLSAPQPAKIAAKSTFSGDAIIRLKDQTDGGYSTTSTGHRIINLTIDGVLAKSVSTFDGIKAAGRIRDVFMDRVCVQDVSGRGFGTSLANGYYPYSWWVTNCIANRCNSYGFAINNMTDSNFINCQTLYCGFSNAGVGQVSGWLIGSGGNTSYTHCRSEWSGKHGFEITGSWGSGNYGNDVSSFVNCTTDRNNYSGFFINATGASSLNFIGCKAHRDGNAGSYDGPHAGFKVAGTSSTVLSTLPVLVTGLVTFPGQGDDGTGAVTPAYAAYITNAKYVAFDGATLLHGVTAGLYDGGGNTFLRRGANVAERTGNPSAATDVFNNGFYFDSGILYAPSFNGSGAGITELTASQVSGVAALASANTFTVGPQTVKTGSDSNKALVLQRNSATQSSNLLSAVQSDGTTEITRIRANGQFGIGTLIGNSALSLNTDLLGDNRAITIKSGQTSPTNNAIELLPLANNTPVMKVDYSGNLTALSVTATIDGGSA